MRKVILENKFKRDAKKHYLKLLTPSWAEILHCLVNDLPLEKQFKDHALTGNWKGFRDCHVQPDLVLIYCKNGDYLQLVRLGTHSELF